MRQPIAGLIVVVASSMGMRVVAGEIAVTPQLETYFALGKISKSSNNSQGVEYGQNWMKYMGATVSLRTELSEKLSLEAGVGGELSIDFRGAPLDAATAGRSSKGYFNKGFLRWTPLGTLAEPVLTLTAGYFPFKYNTYAHDLGLYLTRGPLYPGFLEASYAARETEPVTHETGLPTRAAEYQMNGKATLAGLHLRHDIRTIYTQDLLVLSAIDQKPYYDLSFLYLGTVNLFDVVKLGGGVNFYHGLPLPGHFGTVDERLETPGKDEEMKTENSNFYVNPADSTDTTFYSFRGVKTMVRLEADPVRRFKPGFFKEDDLILYGEAAILGVKDYAGPYDTLSQRIPVMVGLNVPTHPFISYGFLTALQVYGLAQGKLWNLMNPPHSVAAAIVFPVLGAGTWALNKFAGIDLSLDLLSTEVEWYGARYELQTDVLWRYMQPTPADGGPYNAGIDDWKWSIQASKTISKMFRVRAQASNDHLRPHPPDDKHEEATVAPEDWYWMFGFEFFF